MIRAYVRVSSDKQAASNGTDSQRHAISQAIGDEPRRWYEDLALSGKSMDRPELQRLLSDLQPGDTLIAYSLSRLGRTAAGLLDLVQTLNAKGARLRLLKEAADTATPMGRCILTIIAAIAEVEREQIVERAQAGIAARKAKGILLGAAARTTQKTKGKKTGWTKVLPHQWKEIQKAYNNGARIVDLAKDYGVGRGYMYRKLRTLK